MTTARQTYANSVASAFTEATTGGISNLSIATVDNQTTWSLQNAAVERNNGTITQAQYVAIVNAIAAWEQSQIQAAKDTLRSTGDVDIV